MNKLDSYLFPTEVMMPKNKKKRLVTRQDIEAALQLIQLKNCHRNIVITPNSNEHLGCQIHEPLMKIVIKSKEFLQAKDINVNHDYDDNDDDKNSICEGGYENIRKRKSDGIASCSSSVTFDLNDNSDEDAYNQVVGSVKKMNKFRSMVDIYNVTKPL
ncbi:hypothetical protein POM88_043795 [Heracleum sosnowskyi]|uniref:Uncharacterized protein n=1 Tax=Heracleum sosnowskyi TaxID=360622 RepID=A0AAD8H498_9APIA|nr:hypothetical protein POM88_043795 [Heracleum sosnowskyi]